MESIFSPSWYRVAQLKPRLKTHVEIYRHNYRAQIWHVMHDRLNGRFHRLGREAYYVIGCMNGSKTFQEIWDQALEYLGDDAPTQEEMIQLLAQLHAGDLLLCDVTPDCVELFHRYERHEKQKWRQRIWSPLSLRFPLWNPENFLERWKFLISPLFGRLGGLAWLAVVVWAAVVGFSHWDDLTKNISDRILAPDNLFILFFVYPFVKALHELGHAFATKAWGGEVHEMGVMLLVFMPVPYVDASSASAFHQKSRRMVVGLAGIMVEMFLAAIALFVWVNIEPGLVRSVAYNVLLIGGVSTLFFNGNPLLRFDGYYVFSDAIEIPNLYARANNYLGYLVQRYLFGMRKLKNPVSTSGEKGWLSLYGVASYCYRLFIVFSIVIFIAGKFFFIGVVLAIWATITSILIPVGKAIRFVTTSPSLAANRARALAVSLSVIAGITAFLMLVPMPLGTRAEGVVWLPENAFVRTKTAGFVESLLMEPFSTVKAGKALVQMQDPFLSAEREALQYEVRGFEAQYKAALYEEKDKAQIIKEELLTTQAKLKRAQERSEQLTVYSPGDGVFIVPRAEDLPARWVTQGGLLGYVVNYPIVMVRVVVTQDVIGLIRQRTRAVGVRFVEFQTKIHSAKIVHEAPAATDQLPSIALGQAGGGEIAIDPSNAKGDKTFDTVFQFDLLLEDTSSIRNVGERVYVRFDHGKEPLALQWYRKIRQLFLRRFSL